jgi:hypothetical protein
MPSAVNTASKTGREFRVPVAQQEPQASHALVEVHQQVPRLLGHPGTGRMCGHPDQMDLAGGELQEEQHVDPLEKYGFDSEEVAGQDRVRSGGQKLLPRRSRSAWRRVHAGPLQDLPHRAGRNPVAQAHQFPLNAPVARGRVLRGQAQYYRADLLINR